jgi:hypothetical protein
MDFLGQRDAEVDTTPMANEDAARAPRREYIRDIRIVGYAMH